MIQMFDVTIIWAALDMRPIVSLKHKIQDLIDQGLWSPTGKAIRGPKTCRVCPSPLTEPLKHSGHLPDDADSFKRIGKTPERMRKGLLPG